jgi:hypothetical protein
MIRKVLPLLLANLLIVLQLTAFAQQNVGIGTTTPDNSSILDVTSSSQGLLMPRLTTAQRNAIISPAQSLLIYNITTKCFEFWENGLWQTLGCATVTCNLDQSQLLYNSGTSARNLLDYTVFQTFTAGITGTLCRIDMGFFNTMTGTETLKIFAGSGILGTLLQSQTVTVSGSGTFFQTFNVSAPVTAGQVYTFQFIPTQGGGLPDPYGVQCNLPSAYSSGEYFITDPSGTYNMNGDLVFKTYVQ